MTKKRLKQTERSAAASQPWSLLLSPSLAVLLQHWGERLEWSEGRRGSATKTPLPIRNEAQCTHIQNEFLLFVSSAL